jgi:CNT family concentrative nucleoside transporter
MQHFSGLLGVLSMLALAYGFSTDRRAIRIKTVAWGVGLQFLFAVLVLKVPLGQRVVEVLGDATTWVLTFSFSGSELVFGALGKRPPAGGSPTDFYFAFQVLPNIVYASALIAIFQYFGVIQRLIRAIARLMTATFHASGAESLNVAATIFIGQSEAPLTIRAYLPDLTRSELMTVMTSGMAHVSGGMLAAYILFGVDAKHLLSAVIMTAPGSLLMAKMLVPETETPKTAALPGDEPKRWAELSAATPDSGNVLAAIADGTAAGVKLAIGVGAMLVTFIALVALLNGLFAQAHALLDRAGFPWFPSDLEVVLGYAFAPLAWLIGVPMSDVLQIGNLLGTRMVLNEFIAFYQLGQIKAQLDPKSFTIATYALCGFANFSSIGIQIGGIGALAPNKTPELASLGLRAMLAGTMANLMSASIAGVML